MWPLNMMLLPFPVASYGLSNLARRHSTTIVHQAHPPTAFPSHCVPDRGHHTGTHGTWRCLLGIRRLVRPSDHAVSNGMRWLARITRSRNPFPQDAINVPERRA